MTDDQDLVLEALRGIRQQLTLTLHQMYKDGRINAQDGVSALVSAGFDSTDSLQRS